MIEPEPTKHEERVERILGVAADLLLRWGYKRITVENIAERAQIGKGTIYLHWKTKEALFQTLLLREAVAIWRELLQRLRSDSAEVRLSRLMRTVLLIMMERPLARALFRGDVELLGKLAGRGVDRAVRSQQMFTREGFVARLRDAGLIRSDMELGMQMYALQATISGFLLIEPDAETGSLSLEHKALALLETIERAFEPTVLPASTVIDEAATQLIAWMEQVCADTEHQMDVLSGLTDTKR